MLSEIDDHRVPGPPEAPADPLAAVLRPVRAGNAFEETVERLLQIIKLGVVAHGERLPPERELAPRLGISRVTLREAIRALQQEGYVESRRGRSGGTFVTYRTPRPRSGDLARVAEGQVGRLTDALTYRMAVETGAAQLLATMELTEAQAARLRRAQQEANAAGEADYRRLDARFHLTVAELTGSTLLATACADARMRVTDLLNAIPVLQRNIEHSAVQHEAIVNAVLAGDPEAARRAVVEHLEGTAALLRGFLA
ncbi:MULTISPECIES: FadR/GntR family transcriptional regulator [Thermomonospora]|uniref:DNA-binding FadR family transcriptional regulator n=1 Tax=Thermomonospora cellulosilytica TaxID=1411118 RepID=A0A7W3RC98_9ACTN|nr:MULTISPECIES: FCD domain-containing protein [Thermomonospora]MBA9007619.1 DNA-binding FadR family transcriptional regulator [Thermomonospora cellulosilytica]